METFIQKNEDLLQMIKDRDKQIEQLQVRIICLTEEHTVYRENEFARQEERKKMEDGKREKWLKRTQETQKLTQESLAKAEATIRTLKFEAQRRKREAFESFNKITEDEKLILQIIQSKVEDILALYGSSNIQRQDHGSEISVVNSETDRSEEDVKIQELPESKHIQILTHKSLKDNHRSCNGTEKSLTGKKYDNVYTQIAYTGALSPSPQADFEIIEKLHELKEYLIRQQERVVQLAASTREQIYDVTNSSQKILGRQRILTLGKNKSCERQRRLNPPESPTIINCGSCKELKGAEHKLFSRHIKAYHIKDNILTNSNHIPTRNSKERIRTCFEERIDKTFSQANRSSGPLFSIAEEEEETQLIGEKEMGGCAPTVSKNSNVCSSPENSKEFLVPNGTATSRMFAQIHQEEEKRKQINGSLSMYNRKNEKLFQYSSPLEQSGNPEKNLMVSTKAQSKKKKKIMFCCTATKSKQQ